MTLTYMPIEKKPAQKMDELNGQIQESLSLIFTSFYKCRGQLCGEIEQRTQEIQKLLEELQEYSTHDYLSKKEIVLAKNILINYQNILRNIRMLTTLTRTKNLERILFMEKTLKEMNELLSGINSLFTHLNDAILTKNPVLLEHILQEKKKYKELSRKFAQKPEECLIKGICPTRSSSLYLSLLDSIKDILWNIQKIAEELRK